MPKALVAIYSKRMILPEGVGEATLFMEGGLIKKVVRGLAMAEGLVDMGDLVVMAGMIDPHVHINEPGRTDWEGFDTAGRAAIAGGITMLVDMPLNASPVTTTGASFDKKLSAATGQLHCDVGFWGGVVPGNDGEIAGLIDRGVLGFKAFLTHSGIDDFPNVTEDDLRKVMPVIAASGLPLLVHCEWEGAVASVGGKGAASVSGKGAAATGERDLRSYREYLLSRPARWEQDAIALMIRLCEEFGCRTHIVHLSSAASIGSIRRAKERGLALTVETAQHYLYFAAEDIGDGQTYFKCAPPIRERENNELLWEGLREGVIDFVATDHSPAPPDLKMAESGDLMRAWGGISSLQLALPVLWTAAKHRGFGLEDVFKWLCAGPAVLAGQSLRKGRIASGYQADLVVWDPGRSFVVEASGLYHRHKGTPYLGQELYGVVEQTWLGGEKVYDRKKGVMLLNKGRMVT